MSPEFNGSQLAQQQKTDLEGLTAPNTTTLSLSMVCCADLIFNRALSYLCAVQKSAKSGSDTVILKSGLGQLNQG